MTGRCDVNASEFLRGWCGSRSIIPLLVQQLLQEMAGELVCCWQVEDQGTWSL